MTELTVADVVFALKELQISIDSVLLRRIEWSLGEGNHDWPQERLGEVLGDFVLRNRRSWQLVSSQMSLDDFLCENGVSLESYRQCVQFLNNSARHPSLLNSLDLDSLDCDSTIVVFAQRHSEQDVILHKLRELGLSHIQCRIILGLGTKSYERLKKRIQDHRKEEIGRRGRSEDDAWSFAKHVLSELCIRLFREANKPVLLMLETHQGIGDATHFYRRHGHVLGFDNNEGAHRIVLERAQNGGFYRNARELYLRRATLTEACSSEIVGSHVFVTEEATPSEQGLQLLINQGFRFDAIDVDPWTTSKPFFSDVLNVLASPGLAMLTLGDQHPWPKGEAMAWERFGVEGYNTILTEQIKQTWRRTWMFQRLASAWYMRAAAARSVCLLPIIVMRNFEPWAPRDDFVHGAMGVDRIYFLGKHVFDTDKLEQVFQSWTEPLPYFENRMLRTKVSTYASSSSILSLISFSDEIWPAMKPFWSYYHEWLLATTEDISSRWRFPEPLEVSEMRNSLQRAIEQTCLDKVVAGYHLADSYLRTL